jgi:hypothetical protein
VPFAAERAAFGAHPGNDHPADRDAAQSRAVMAPPAPLLELVRRALVQLHLERAAAKEGRAPWRRIRSKLGKSS